MAKRPPKTPEEIRLYNNAKAKKCRDLKRQGELKGTMEVTLRLGPILRTDLLWGAVIEPTDTPSRVAKKLAAYLRRSLAQA